MIIGNGPAGISAGIYAKRTGLDVTIIGKDSGALKKADKVENYYGFSEPIKGVDLVQNGINQAKRLGITIINEEVISIEFNEDYIIKTDKNEKKTEDLLRKNNNKFLLVKLSTLLIVIPPLYLYLLN